MKTQANSNARAASPGHCRTLPLKIHTSVYLGCALCALSVCGVIHAALTRAKRALPFRKRTRGGVHQVSHTRDSLKWDAV